ncbi:hypothetical protein T07_636 [Trichinella nelsoni]|uniref:Uncharacterized protein n=1 Tax=Trichinella nelsoni TaxID=6336 RepID=A0A0V0SDP8_9BILA|nr:hypothetical protein T07_636 [Trichinella nelsoni]
MTSLRTTDDSKFSLLTHPSTDCGWYQDFPLHAKSLHGMKKKYCIQYDCSETLLLGAKLTVKINTDSATLSKEEFFQVKQKKRSNNIILSRIEAIWTRSVENCNLRHRYEVLRIGDEAQYVVYVMPVVIYARHFELFYIYGKS